MVFWSCFLILIFPWILRMEKNQTNPKCQLYFTILIWKCHHLNIKSIKRKQMEIKPVVSNHCMEGDFWGGQRISDWTWKNNCPQEAVETTKGAWESWWLGSVPSLLSNLLLLPVRLPVSPSSLSSLSPHKWQSCFRWLNVDKVGVTDGRGTVEQEGKSVSGCFFL